MAAKVVWTETARAEYLEALSFIARDNPVAADRVYQRIEMAAENLSHFATGRKGHLPGTYEKILPDLPYIIVYQPDEMSGTIFILRLLHTRQNRPETPPETST